MEATTHIEIEATSPPSCANPALGPADLEAVPPKQRGEALLGWLHTVPRPLLETPPTSPSAPHRSRSIQVAAASAPCAYEHIAEVHAAAVRRAQMLRAAREQLVALNLDEGPGAAAAPAAPAEGGSLRPAEVAAPSGSAGGAREAPEVEEALATVEVVASAGQEEEVVSQEECLGEAVAPDTGSHLGHTAGGPADPAAVIAAPKEPRQDAPAEGRVQGGTAPPRQSAEEAAALAEACLEQAIAELEEAQWLPSEREGQEGEDGGAHAGREEIEEEEEEEDRSPSVWREAMLSSLESPGIEALAAAAPWVQPESKVGDLDIGEAFAAGAPWAQLEGKVGDLDVGEDYDAAAAFQREERQFDLEGQADLKLAPLDLKLAVLPIACCDRWPSCDCQGGAPLLEDCAPLRQCLPEAVLDALEFEGVKLAIDKSPHGDKLEPDAEAEPENVPGAEEQAELDDVTAAEEQAEPDVVTSVEEQAPDPLAADPEACERPGGGASESESLEGVAAARTGKRQHRVRGLKLQDFWEAAPRAGSPSGKDADGDGDAAPCHGARCVGEAAPRADSPSGTAADSDGDAAPCHGARCVEEGAPDFTPTAAGSASRDRPRSSEEPRRGGSSSAGASPQSGSPDASPASGTGAPVASPQPVLLHIYDVSKADGVQLFNKLFAHPDCPVKLGGIFHVGVEIEGQEWWFGAAPSGSGVAWTRPRTQRDHNFRETIALAPTKLTKGEVRSLLVTMSMEWAGPSYHLLRRNCCHFADDLCQRLGVGRVPPWVYRLAGFGSSALTGVSSLEEKLGLLQLSRSVLSALPPAQAPGTRALLAAGEPQDMAPLPQGFSRDGMPL